MNLSRVGGWSRGGEENVSRPAIAKELGTAAHGHYKRGTSQRRLQSCLQPVPGDGKKHVARGRWSQLRKQRRDGGFLLGTSEVWEAASWPQRSRTWEGETSTEEGVGLRAEEVKAVHRAPNREWEENGPENRLPGSKGVPRGGTTVICVPGPAQEEPYTQGNTGFQSGSARVCVCFACIPILAHL